MGDQNVPEMEICDIIIRRKRDLFWDFHVPSLLRLSAAAEVIQSLGPSRPLWRGRECSYHG